MRAKKSTKKRDVQTCCFVYYLLFIIWRSRCRRRRRILRTLMNPPGGKCWNCYFKTYNKLQWYKWLCLSLWCCWNWVFCGQSWKSSIPIFFHLPPRGIWLIFSMLFSSHPKSKWREKKFCWFEFEPICWTTIWLDWGYRTALGDTVIDVRGRLSTICHASYRKRLFT